MYKTNALIKLKHKYNLNQTYYGKTNIKQNN